MLRRAGVFGALARTLLNQAVRRVIHGTLRGRLAFSTLDSMTARMATAIGPKFKGHLRGAHSRGKFRKGGAAFKGARLGPRFCPTLAVTLNRNTPP